MVARQIFPYKITCPFCHSFDTFQECRELGQLSTPPHYLYSTGRYAAVCDKCGVKLSKMKLKMKQGRAVEKYRPVASILSYDVLELPDFMQEVGDAGISAYRW